MKLKCRYILLLLTLLFVLPDNAAWAQGQWREIHKVKKKETIFGIARDYGITMEQLKEANPEMKDPDYKLKKGDFIFIPYPQASVGTAPASAMVQVVDDVRSRAIRLGVMLPLHSKNGDGHRMMEYYRGVLMACDSLKKKGISTEVWAWDVPEDGDVATALGDVAAAKCDIILGPLYSKFVPKLSRFVEEHDILMVIPFSIHAPELFSNRNIFQVFQTQNHQNEIIVQAFKKRFKDYHPVIVDCADSTSTKGAFTSLLRRELDVESVPYKLTSLKSSDENFANAFSRTKPNVVILNSSRSTDLTQVFGKLSTVSLSNSDIRISMLGYSEWMMYTKRNLDNFYKYDVYIPSPFFTNLTAASTERISQDYRANFRQDMMQTLPRFAITGFDHAMFFLQGLHMYGKTFTGARGLVGYQAVQTPLMFERIGNGGLQNHTMLFVHYTPGKKVETITN